MDAHVKEVVREMTKASDEERIAFPDVVRALMAVGLERYHADLICSNKTYYISDGDFEITACHAVSSPAQSVGYFVTIVGRRAIYYGRNGDSHIEWFPGAK